MKHTIIYQCRKDEDYHFYYDDIEKQYKLDTKNKRSKQMFYKRIGKILSSCPLSDHEINKDDKKFRPVCPVKDN